MIANTNTMPATGSSASALMTPMKMRSLGPIEDASVPVRRDVDLARFHDAPPGDDVCVNSGHGFGRAHARSPHRLRCQPGTERARHRFRPSRFSRSHGATKTSARACRRFRPWTRLAALSSVAPCAFVAFSSLLSRVPPAAPRPRPPAGSSSAPSGARGLDPRSRCGARPRVDVPAGSARRRRRGSLRREGARPLPLARGPRREGDT